MKSFRTVDLMLRELIPMLKNQNPIPSRLGNQHEILNWSYKIETPSRPFSFREINQNYARNFVNFILSFDKPTEMHEHRQNLMKINPKVSRFLDTEKYEEIFPEGNSVLYPSKLKSGYLPAIEELKKRPDSRRAIVPMLTESDSRLLGALDGGESITLEFSCTESFAFFIRNETLNLHINMRSQNMLGVFPYDWFLWVNLLERTWVEHFPKFQMGEISSNITFCHIYEEKKPESAK